MKCIKNITGCRLITEFLKAFQSCKASTWTKSWLNITDSLLEKSLIHIYAFNYVNLTLLFIIGKYQCGPCSLRAIKEGDVDAAYDGKFILAEVNSDIFYHKKNEEGRWEVVRTNRSHVGKSSLN